MCEKFADAYESFKNEIAEFTTTKKYSKFNTAQNI